MLKAQYKKFTLKFKSPAGTSRGVLHEKDSYILKLYHSEKPEIFGLGECSPLIGLSIDNFDDYQKTLDNTCQMINQSGEIPADLDLDLFPSIDFGLETALLDLENGGIRKIVHTDFFNNGEEIEINGLVWMSDKENMKIQIKDKIDQGFKCIKLKIGAINFDDECYLLEEIRKNFSEEDLEIRVDANGAFTNQEALEKLQRLAKYNLHSIEQPIKQGQWSVMANLCKETPLAIALDEELIGVTTEAGKKLLLQIIQPQYIVLKPTLLGGFQSSQEWIETAYGMDIDWWITSALESNIGLNAICQWASTFDLDEYQGLGTGQIYQNNFDSPLVVEKGCIKYDKAKSWKLDLGF